MKRYPQLGPAKVLDALAFAWDNLALMEYEIAQEQTMFAGEKVGRTKMDPSDQLALPFSTKSKEEPRR